tara:strand:+ start:4585 stop:5082 length:498 start_codon:yes stop_codon:yes gene_type:complete
MKLTKNFTLQEMIFSATAQRLCIDNSATKEGIIKLRLLCLNLLQPLRNAVGSIRVTSAYRCPALSEAIGSSASSQHCRYEAVDIQHVSRGKMDNLKIYKALIDLDLDYDQCILEFGDSSALSDPMFPAWVHLSWKVSDNRRETLVAYKDMDNKTRYRPLIEYKSI